MKPNNPELSIILPVYNDEKNIAAAISSIQQQTEKNFELIIVDNNSTDATPNILARYAQQDKRIKLLTQLMRGRGSARWLGEQHAQGSIVISIDSDCIAPKNWLKKLIEPIKKNQADLVQGFEKTNTPSWYAQMIQLKREQSFAQIKTRGSCIGTVDTKNCAMRKSLLEKIGYTNPTLVTGNDFDLSIRCARRKAKIVYQKENYVLHENPKKAKEVWKKNYIRGYWMSKIIAQYHEDIPRKIVEEHANTLWGFFKIAIGLPKTVIKKGIKLAYFDALEGISWRAGVLSYRIEEFFKIA